MGTSNSATNNIDIFIELDKEVYMAGSQVTGNIYLNVKNNYQYEGLYLKLQGRQKVSWTSGNDQSSNNIQTYLDQFTIASFNGQLQMGHYSFPFAFYLPNQMIGSLSFDPFNFIKYTLTAQLRQPKADKISSQYEINLNIMERFKDHIAEIYKEQTTQSFLCCYCLSYGKIKISIKCDKNLAMVEQELRINAVIDSSQSSLQLQNCRFVLSCICLKVCSAGFTDRSINRIDIYTPKNTTIKSKTQQNYSFSFKVPTQIVRNTTIGNTIAYFYTIDFMCDIGCSNSFPPKCSLNIFINTQKPLLDKKQTVAIPQNWNPRIFQKIVYRNMKPYIYSPMLAIKFLKQQATSTRIKEHMIMQPQNYHHLTQKLLKEQEI